uniref:mannosyl-oligosaccharide glucosidase n=1 Tax=Neospora caninum (strain Liverpool) TaxID=572307 RepID=A0A0F7U7V0_NEOCL|nr:TPA: mannosyl-oligosaccharide glucosidase [Neospora caninum Liverpool]
MRPRSLFFSALCKCTRERPSSPSLFCLLSVTLLLSLADSSLWLSHPSLGDSSASFLLPVCEASQHPSSSSRASPSPSPSLSSAPFPVAFERATAWGAYRPAAYFSLRAATHARGFLTGLAWGGEGIVSSTALHSALAHASHPSGLAQTSPDSEGARLAPGAPQGEDPLEWERARRKREQVHHLIRDEDILDDRRCKGGSKGESETTVAVDACTEGTQFQWKEHDGLFYGSQDILHRRRVSPGARPVDTEDLKIRTTFAKHPVHADKIFSFRLSASVERGERGQAAERNQAATVASLFVYFTSEDEDFAVFLHPDTKRQKIQAARRLYLLGRGDSAAEDLLAVVETKLQRRERGEGEKGDRDAAFGIFFGSSLLSCAATQAWDAASHIEHLLRKSHEKPATSRGEGLDAFRHLPNEEEEDANFFALQVLGSVPAKAAKEHRDETDEEDDGDTWEEEAEEDALVIDVHVFTGGILGKGDARIDGANPRAQTSAPGRPQQANSRCDFDCLSSLSIEEIDKRIQAFLFSSSSPSSPSSLSPSASSPSSLSPSSSSPLGGHLSYLARLYSRLFHLHLEATFPGPSPLALRSAMISNLLGGRGFFAGKLPVSPAAHEAAPLESRDEEEQTASEGERPAKPEHDAPGRLLGDLALFSFVPARMKFPRPCLWDEGMHELVALEWFPLLAAQNLVSWMQMLKTSDQIYPGWLPRELVLNSEMAMGMPPAFLVQHPEAGNPPTLVFALEKLVDIAAQAPRLRHPLFRLLTQNRLPSRDQIEGIAALAVAGGKRRGQSETKRGGQTPASLLSELVALTDGPDGNSSAEASLSTVLANCIQAIAPLLTQWINYYVHMHTTIIDEAPNTSSSPTSSSSAPTSSSSAPTSSSSSPTSSSSSPTSSSLPTPPPSSLSLLLDPRRYPKWHELPPSAPAASFSSGLDDFPRPLQVYDRAEEAEPPAAHLDLHVWFLGLLRGAERVCAFLENRTAGGPRDTQRTKESRACRETYGPALASLIVKLLGVDTPQSVFTSLLVSDSCSAPSSAGVCNWRVQPPTASSLYLHAAGILVDFATKQPLVKTRREDEPQRLVPVPVWPWREDGRCGREFPIATGRPALCNPLSASPCCSAAGFCGASQEYCACASCFRTPALTERRFWGYEAVGPAPSSYVGVPSLLPLALGLLPWRGHLPFLVASGPEGDARAARPAASGDTGDAREAGDVLLRRVMDVAENEELGFSSAFGLRSLRKGDALYHQASDYWRGDVWIHISAFVLSGIRRFYLNGLTAREMQPGDERHTAFLKNFYATVRRRVLLTVEREWERKQQFYERYSDIDGTGKGPFPFAGWTTMYLLLLTEK